MSNTAEIDTFLNTTEFTGCQRVPLLYGREIPDRDRSAPIRQILEDAGVSGKSVLDVGTYYGALLAEAAELGATATGLEPGRERYSVAEWAAHLAGDRWSVVNGSIDDLGVEDRFQVVAVQNVIHHVDDPINFLQELDAHCDETLVVGCPLAHDVSVLRYFWDDPEHRGSRPRITVAVRTFFWSLILQAMSRDIPVSVAGQLPCHRRWHYSIPAFRIVAEQMIDNVRSVEVKRWSWHRYRAVAKIEMGSW